MTQNFEMSQKAREGKESYQSEVFFTIKNCSKSIEIHVKDNGRGIFKDALRKFFQPFFTTKLTGQCTGLGLILSYNIVRAHGDDLKEESQIADKADEAGTTFIIIFPKI